VVIPCPQKQFLAIRNEPPKLPEFLGGKTAAASQPHRLQPEFCPIPVSFDVDMRWFIVICRIESE
jgi:hypothetical protein